MTATTPSSERKPSMRSASSRQRFTSARPASTAVAVRVAFPGSLSRLPFSRPYAVRTAAINLRTCTGRNFCQQVSERTCFIVRSNRRFFDTCTPLRLPDVC